MGSFILCHKYKAKEPYYIKRIRKKIYTIEELCYFLCNNLYLIDESIIGSGLFRWIEKELRMQDLAEKLYQMDQAYASVPQMASEILSYTGIYTAAGLQKIKEQLSRFAGLKDAEKQKYKADNLLHNGESGQAIVIYRTLLREEKDETLPPAFYGNVCAALGAAYGRQFLYEEAAEMYREAYRITQKESFLKAWLYALRMSTDPSEYETMVMSRDLYIRVNEEITKELQVIRKEQEAFPENVTDLWKEAYR